MIIEILISAIIAFGVGSYVGQQTKPEEQSAPIRSPDIWPPVSHNELLRTCSLSCGENNLQEYSALYGKCVCKKK